MQLRDEVLCPDYRPHHQLGEERQEQHVIDEVLFWFELSSIYVYGITEVLECVEGDTYWDSNFY
jgi:hypothetical protein